MVNLQSFRHSIAGRIPGYFTLCFGITLIGIGMSITRPYLSLFCTDILHMSPAQIGTFMCVNAIGSIVATTWMAKLSDSRAPRKDIMWISALCSGLGYLAFLIFHNFIILLAITTILLGVGMSTFPQMFAYARESASSAGDTTFAISALRSFFSLAWVIGPLLGSWILASFHYNALFMSTFTVYLVVMTLVLFRLRRKPPSIHRIAQASGFLDDIRRKEVFISCLGFCAAFTASSMNGTYMPLYVTRYLHAPEHVVGWVFSLSAGLEIPIMIGLGAVANRVGKRVLLIVGSTSGTLYYILALFAHHAWEILALQLFCAIFISIYMSIGMSYFQDFMPDSPGSATTLYSNTNNFGSMAGSIVGGLIAQAFSFRSVYVMCTVLGIASLASLLIQQRASRSPSQT